MIDSASAMRPGKRMSPAAGRSLVPDLAAGAGRRAGKRRDRRRVVVGLDLEDGVRQLVAQAVLDRDRTGRVIAARIEARHHPALDDGGVVAVGDDGALRSGLVRRLDHPEQRLGARLAVDGPARVEDLVTAVLRVRLREHHQLDIGRIALQPRERVDEVVDLVFRQGEPHVGVGARQRGAAVG
jgi:hypothetical protein